MPTITRGVWRVDRAALQPVKRCEDGSIRCDSLVARTGTLHYLMPDGSRRIELRLHEDVFDGPALRSFDLRPLTDDHPGGMIDADTAADVAIGAVTDPRRDGDHLRAGLSVWDPDAIAKMEQGKLELSGGYTCDTIEESGTHPVYGPYHARQVRIFGNHVALVDRGRAGPECRARMDRAAIMILDEDDAHVAPRAAPTEIGPADIVDPEIWARAFRAGFRAEARIPDDKRARRADAYLAAVRRELTPALDRLRTRRTDAAPARSFFLPPPPSFPRLSPQPRTDTAMGKKHDSESPFASETEAAAIMAARNNPAYAGMTDKQIRKAMRRADKALRRDREANAAAFAARRADAARFTFAPRPRADASGLPDERSAAEALQRRNERAWQGPGNAGRYRSGS